MLGNLKFSMRISHLQQYISRYRRNSIITVLVRSSLVLLIDNNYFDNAQTITPIWYAQSKISECNLVQIPIAVRKHRAIVIMHYVFILLLYNYFNYIIL